MGGRASASESPRRRLVALLRLAGRFLPGGGVEEIDFGVDDASEGQEDFPSGADGVVLGRSEFLEDSLQDFLRLLDLVCQVRDSFERTLGIFS
jgi:hypothetical protein